MMEDINGKYNFKKKSILVLLIGIFLILNISFISAFEFDNIKSTLETKGLAGYNDVEIKNAFGLGATLWKGTLDSNTETCSSDCSATQTIILYKDGSLVDDIRFMTLQDDESWKEQSIRSYQFYIKNKDKWEKYNLGDEVPTGTHYLKLEGEKNMMDTVDWQITSQGILIEDWALWSAEGGIISYYKFDDASGTTATDEEGRDDFTMADSWTVDGKFNGAYDQSGQVYKDQAGSVLGTMHGDDEAISMSFWVKRVGADWVSTDTLWSNDDAGLDAEGECLFEMANAASKGWRLDCKDDTSTKRIDNFDGLPANGEWVFLVVTVNSTHAQVFINGTQDVDKVALSNFAWHNTNVLQLFTQSSNAAYTLDDAYVDEIGIWNRTLTHDEVDELYNGGVGIPYGGSEVTISLNKPPESYDTVNRTIDFNCSATKLGGGIINLTLEVNGVVNETVYNATADINLSLAKTITFPIGDNYNWTCYGYDVGDVLGTTDDRFFNVSFLVINSQDFNATTYETASETYSINVSANSSLTTANLIWDGISYTATQSGDIWSRTLDIVEITSPVNKSFHWNFTYSGSQISSVINNVSIGNTNFSICGGEGGNTPFINFTFLDEETLTSVNATTDLASWNYWLGSGSVSKSYLFTNTTENPSYAFCALPNQTFHNNLTFQYASSSYPQRIHVRGSDLTNVTTNQVLYLLSSTDGIYATIQTTDIVGTTIIGVSITVERQFSGVWTQIGEEDTDSSGLVTFWVNPDYSHRFTFVKAGYSVITTTLRPTQTTYTQIMSSGASAIYSGNLEGMKWTFSPSGGIKPVNVTTFYWNITADLDNIVSCRFELVNSTRGVLNSTITGCGSGGGNLSLSYNLTENLKLWGRGYIDLGGGLFLVDGDAYWIGHDTNVSSTETLKYFFENLKNLNEFGEGVEQEFSKIVFFFLILVILLGFLTFTTGWDMQNPGAIIMLLYPIILFSSITGWFTFEGLIKPSILISATGAAYLDQYMFAFITGLFTFGFILNYWSRNS